MSGSQIQKYEKRTEKNQWHRSYYFWNRYICSQGSVLIIKHTEKQGDRLQSSRLSKSVVGGLYISLFASTSFVQTHCVCIAELV